MKVINFSSVELESRPLINITFYSLRDLGIGEI